jgi:hypothetical protein
MAKLSIRSCSDFNPIIPYYIMKKIAHIAFALLATLTMLILLKAQESPKEEDFYKIITPADPGRNYTGSGWTYHYAEWFSGYFHTPWRSLDRG